MKTRNLNKLGLLGGVCLLLTSCDPLAGKITITFDSRGGTEIAPIRVNSNTVIEKPTDPKKEGSTFLFWSTEENGKTPFDFNQPFFYDTTLYAQWDLNVKSYTVTFNSMGGSSIESQTVTYGEKATKPKDPTNTNLDYKFDGWVTSLPINPEEIAFDFENTPITENITLYARWTRKNVLPAQRVELKSSYLTKTKAMNETNPKEYDYYINREDLHTYVGTDNEYILPVNLKDSEEGITFDTSNIDITVKEGQDQLDPSFYTLNGTKIKFEKSAEGKKISVDIKVKGKDTITKIDNLIVTSGFNVYSVADLCLVTHTLYLNGVTEHGFDILRSATVKTERILLQEDLNIKNEDFAGDAFNNFETKVFTSNNEWYTSIFDRADIEVKPEDPDYDYIKDNCPDSKALKDKILLFALNMKADNLGVTDRSHAPYAVGDKEFNGNYYTIKMTEGFSQVVREHPYEPVELNKDLEGHITNFVECSSFLFHVSNEKDDYKIKNVNFVGNSSISDFNESFKNSGGIGFVHTSTLGSGEIGNLAGQAKEDISHAVNVTLDNVHARNSCVAISLWERYDLDGTGTQKKNTKFNLLNSKVYNCFSSSFFVDESRLNIEKSELVHAGGPLFIVHTKEAIEEEGTNFDYYSSKHFLPEVTIDKETVLDNQVLGTEAWFQMQNATIIGTLLKDKTENKNTIDNVFNNYGKTILQKKDNEYTFNFISLTLNLYNLFDAVEAPKYYSLSSFSIGDSRDYLNCNQLNSLYKAIAPQSGVMMYTNNGGIVGLSSEQCPQLGINYGENNLKCSQADYLNVQLDLGLVSGQTTFGGLGSFNLILSAYPLSAETNK